MSEHNASKRWWRRPRVAPGRGPVYDFDQVHVETGGITIHHTEVGDTTHLIQTGDDARAILLPPEAFRPISEIDAPPGINNLPPLPGEFVGRQTELDKLDTILSRPGQVVVQAVHGLGGIGKTTLVAQWAATRPHGHYPVVWITAETAVDIKQGLADFAAALQPTLEHVLRVEQLAERALQWLAAHTGWLLVLDNVDNLTDTAEVIARATTGRIVITSRRATGWRPGTAVIRLGVLEPDESLRLLTSILTTTGPRDTEGAVELCAELGHLPLAVEQAGAFLAQNPFTTPRAYLQMLTDNPAYTYRQTEIGADPERTIARIWKITLDRITTIDPTAAEILRALAWFGPDAIPLTLCRNLADSPTDRPAVDAALGILAAYSMITPDLGGAGLSIHRLVQAVSRTPDPTDPHRDRKAIARARTHAIETLYADLPDRENPVTWPTWRALLPHIDALTEHTTRKESTGTRIAAICSTAGLFLLDQGLHSRAIAHLHRAFTDCERILGPDDLGTLASRSNLAEAYRAAGRVAEAIPLHERTLTYRERVLGPDHPDTLASRSNLANAYRAAGRTAEAVHLHERTFTDSERALGPDHPDTLNYRNNLAEAYRAAGRTAETIPLHERTLIDRERVLGPDHPRTLISRNNLASAYQEAGRTIEAIPLHERTLADCERVLGPDHPDTLNSRNNLANVYGAAGRVAEVIPLHERTLIDRERVLGPDHPRTLASRNNLAEAYRAAGRVVEAIPLHERTLTDCERVLGPDHPDTLTSRNNLAGSYGAVGRFAEAIPFHERTLTDCERVLGPDHPDTLNYRSNLANDYGAAGRIIEAISLHERTLIDRERIIGSDHPDTLTSRSNLANAYRAAGRIIEAISLHERTLIDRERIIGSDHPDTLTSRNNLANAYRAAGRTAEAISLHERVLADSERILGSDHPHTLASCNNLAEVYQAAGRLREAIPLYERTLTGCERILGPDHPRIPNSRNNLAKAYGMAGRLREAIPLFERTLTDCERILGPDHPHTDLVRANLVAARAVQRSRPPRRTRRRR
ncbi:tetratricopeptide repeat protein [Nocardia sp. MH4]|uniref:tetratricopeptide repeat protein n=1 Tax=Nocardia sp. MH4 TaxID=1768677 RepID=UPI001C4FC0C0|nr:tetratricopeptide repeat protein [Nocardia sp. MH4]